MPKCNYLLANENQAQDGPKTPQDAELTAQDAPKTLPKTLPRRMQDAPRRFQDALSRRLIDLSAQDLSFFKTLPRLPQEWTQDATWRPQDPNSIWADGVICLGRHGPMGYVGFIRFFCFTAF